MNNTNIYILLFILFIIKIFLDILIPDKKKEKKLQKKTNKNIEKEKIIIITTIIGIFLFIIISITFPKTTIIIVIISIAIGIYFLLKKVDIKNLDKDFNIHKNEEKQKNIYNKKTEQTEDKYKETKKLETILKNINIQDTSKPQQNMYDTIKKTKTKKSYYQLGKEYEKQIGKYYENLGYKVIYHGIEKKKKDNGIDLIATAEEETIFIQCKNNQNSIIKQVVLRKFIGDCTSFIENNTNKYKNIKRIFIVAKDKKDYGAKKYLENNKSIEYKMIPYLETHN